MKESQIHLRAGLTGGMVALSIQKLYQGLLKKKAVAVALVLFGWKWRGRACGC